MKLSFQRVLMLQNQILNEGIMLDLLQHCILSRTDFSSVTSNVLAISPCRSLQMGPRLNRWKANLMELPNIIKYSDVII